MRLREVSGDGASHLGCVNSWMFPIQYFYHRNFQKLILCCKRAHQKSRNNYLGHKNRARNLNEIKLLLPGIGTVEYRAPDIALRSHPDISTGFGRKGWLRNPCLI